MTQLTPLRAVAPEQTCLASSIMIDGFLGPTSFDKWYAVATPDIPAPIMAMSHSAGSCSVERYSSI